MRGGVRRFIDGHPFAMVLLIFIITSSNAFGAPPQFIISGYVRTIFGVGVDGVSVAGNNGAGSAITGADGAYSITVPNHWSGTISVSKSGWLITPASKTYNRVSANIANENYTAYQPKISGYVKKADSTGLGGANVSASGAGSTTTNTSGYYEIIVPYNWSGTVSASLAGYGFTSKSYSNVMADQANQDFSGYQPKISGYVKKADGTALSGASVSASGVRTTTTNASGYYEIIVPYGWSGTLATSLTGYGFTAKNYTNVTIDQTNQDFSGFQPKISGVITSYGVALEGVTVTASNGGGTAVTDSAGSYSLTVPYGWSGTVTPSKPQYTFTPASKVYSNVTADTVSQNYTAILPPVSISGYVRDGNGTGIVSVNITADNGGGSTATNASGYYSISVPYNWSGMVTAKRAGWQITPASYSYSNLIGNQVNQNFTATYVGIIVKADGTGDFATIQAAIDAAVNEDVVILQPGTYTGTGNRDIDFKGKAITVRGATGDPNDCIINCQGTEAVPHRGFKFVSGENGNSVLEAITIRNGYGVNEDIWGSGLLYSVGGAVYCKNSSPSITNCIIINNYAYYCGGGIGNSYSNPRISSCVISNNSAYTYGSGIHNLRSSPSITNCTIINNSALNEGGGIYNNHSNPSIRSCIISNNSGGITGGGIYNSYYSNPSINNSIIRNNSHCGIYNIGNCNPYISNCIIWGNGYSISSSYGSATVTTYSDVQYGYTGTGNINADPCFIDAYHISPTSPCIDAGDPNYVPDINETDIDGDPRIMVRIDMGIDEVYSSTSALLVISPGILNFEAQGLNSSPQSQYVSIKNYGANLLNWHIEIPSDSNWLNVLPTAGQLNTGEYFDVEVTVDASRAGYGTSSCQLQVVAADAENSPQVLMVNLEVLRPQIGVSTMSYSFTAYGKTSALTPQNLTITNTGYDTLDWQIQIPADCNWLSVTPQAGQVTDGNNIVTLSVDPSKANYGANTCQFTVCAPDASNSPQTVSVSLYVYGPSLHVNPEYMIVYAQTGGIVEKTFTVQNMGYDTMNWYIDEVNDCNWITAITPSSGQCSGSEIDTVAITINPAGLNNGTYQKTITVRSPEYASPRTVTLNLQVYTPNTIHVPTDYPTIQQAVNAAQNGDTIIVHPGRYAGFASNKFLTIQSIAPENPAVVAATIIESTANFSNREQPGGESIVNGLSFIFKQAGQQSSPFRGINFNGGDAIVKNCIIRNFPGAGISLINYSPYKAHAKIENCFITHNAFLYNQDYSGSIFTINYDIELRNSLISNNYSDGLVMRSECINLVKADIINCTIAENGSNHPAVTASCITVPAYSFTDISIKNSILSGILDSNSPIIKINPTEQLINLNIDHSAIQGGQAAISAPNDVNIIWGQGNIESDPCFAKAGFLHDNNTLEYWDDYWIEGDYHLKSRAGRWKQSEFIYMDATGDGIMDMTDFAVLAGEWQTTSIPVSIPGSPYYYQPYLRADLDRNGIVDHNDLVLFCGNYGDYYDYGQWVFDDMNSPCINAGDPNSDWSGELWPHGKRVNMGAFGNTAQASMSADKSGNTADLNKDGVVNLIDYARFSNNIEKPSLPLAEDINRDGFVDILDLCNLCENWLWVEGI